ncbi:polysaccharide deacetylase family protein [candidate division WOR-3 bacterium]|nr:polysaccharide deacetylase family protein [candidate division WOR-3 bacterium]
MIPILLYHKIANFDFGGTWVTPHQFENQMQYLYQNGYTTIQPDELLTSHSSPLTSSILITFDDGYESFYDKALPILLKYGFRAIIFVITNYIGKENLWDVNIGKKVRHLDWSKLRKLKDYGFIIGSHTMTHPDLTKIKLNQIKKEIFNSKTKLEDGLGEEVNFFSFPFGRHNDTVIKIAYEAGYKLLFISLPKANEPLAQNPIVNSQDILGRMGVYIIDSLTDFKIKVQKRKSIYYTFETLKSNIINSFSQGTWIWKTLNPFHRVCI